MNKPDTEKWKTTEAKEYWLSLEDKDGWSSADLKWDGCVHYTRYSNEPLSKDEKDQDYIHICDLAGTIDELYSLYLKAREHYKDHHYFETAWQKEPECIHQTRQEAILEENRAWLEGKRCENCGKEREENPLWSMCDECV